LLAIDLMTHSIAFQLATPFVAQSRDTEDPQSTPLKQFRTGTAVPPLELLIVRTALITAVRRHRPHERVGASPVGLDIHHGRL